MGEKLTFLWICFSSVQIFIICKCYFFKKKNTMFIYLFFKSNMVQGTWLAQSVEHATLDLGVVSASPTLGVEIT